MTPAQAEQQDGSTVPVLPDVHRAYLNEHAITDEVIGRAGIFSRGDEIIFPWTDGDRRTEQRRPWPEPEGGLPPGVSKYLWEDKHKLHLWAHRSVDVLPAGAPVIIAEGTKQSLAVMSWAPPEYAVYGMPGCDIGIVAMLQQAGLDRFAGHPVIISLDADAASNLNVWEGGEKLAGLLDLEGAPSITFTRLPVHGTDGIDDFLASVPEARRTEVLAKLLAKAAPSPAERKPAHRKVAAQLPDTGGRPAVTVNRDRLLVITDILGHMMARWNGRDLFCFGNVLTRIRTEYTVGGHITSAQTEPVDENSFLVWLSAGVATFKHKPPGLTSPEVYEPCWPDPQTVKAVLARGDEFAPLKRLSRAPFIRPDGTVCAKQGYDPATATMLITGNSGMDRLDIPDMPTQDQAAGAARFLLDEWLGDFCWRDESSRASALALILTPIVRGLVPLVPLAVISGLQPGVGKGLLADCIQLMITGEVTPPLPWNTEDDDETRKLILSAFKGGADLMWFDEAHRIESHALSRALTSLTYADRVLGVSKMAAFPNQITWMSTGNQVSVSADMARRAYWIELHPDMPDPDSRPESDFAHPDLRSWTLDNRPELITKALVMARAWFAAGCPAYPRGALMGSFERWDKTMSGILGYARVPGFLAGLAERRAERDTSGGYWAEHLAWLARQFGNGLFTALDVKVRAMASGGAWDAPPGLDEPDTRGWTRNLGQAYGRNRDRWFGGLRIVKAGTGHGTLVKWQVQEQGRDPIHPVHPSPDPGFAQTQTIPDLAGMDRMDQLPAPAPVFSDKGVAQPDPRLHDLDTLPDLERSEANPSRTGRDGLDGLDGSFPLGDSAHAGAHAHAHVREGEGGRHQSVPSNPSAPVPGLRLDFDLEGCDADELFTRERGFTLPDGTGFIRLAGVTGPSGAKAIVPVDQLLALLGAAGEIGGHNILGFDGLALAWHHGLDWGEFCARARDTEIIARQAFPPRSRESGTSADKLGLDAVAQLLGIQGKTDDLHRLKRKHGGYDKIPVDDPEYRSYLEGDLDATRAVADQLIRHYYEDPYLPREHELAGLAGQISLNGFLVDQELLNQRLVEGAQRKAQALALLHDGWGLPLTKTVTRGRGDKKTSHEVAMESPLATDAGRAWLAAQWERYQVPAPPRTEKTGKLALGDDDLKPVAADPACPGDLRAMIALMGIVTGTRTVYQNAAAHLAPDGRVHPKISMRQASGRWSTTGPGLTVFGKHGGRHVERDIFTADEGHVLFSCDLSQVDMRGIAALSQDPAYMAIFADASRDAHAEIAAQVFGDPHGGHCPPGCQLRQNAKARGHGWNYGLGPKRMIEEGADPDMVYRFVSGMTERFPRLCGWREEIRAIARAGMILDNGFGRRMRADPARAYTVAPALMGQGSAGDIMKEVLRRLDRRAPELRPYYRVMVHDEQVFSCPEKDAPEIIKTVQEAFTWEWAPPGASTPVPIRCDVNGPGRTWGEISAK